MPIASTSRRTGVWASLVLALIAILAISPQVLSGVNSPNTPTLIVSVSDTTADDGAQNAWLTIAIANTNDTVAAFTINLILDRPDIMRFKIDTIVYEGSQVVTGFLDTSHAAVSGWEYVQSRSNGWEGQELLINGIAEYDHQVPYKSPLAPQSGRVLCRVLCNILSIPDTLTDRTAKVKIEKGIIDRFVFSRPDGTAIGFYNVYVPDTLCYYCESWNSLHTHCLSWKMVTTPPCDSIVPVIDTVPKLDTSKVWAIDGSMTAGPSCCHGTRGNVNAVGIIDLSDLSALVSYLTGGGYNLPCAKAANVNGAGIVDLSDLSALVSYLTGGGYTLPPCS